MYLPVWLQRHQIRARLTRIGLDRVDSLVKSSGMSRDEVLDALVRAADEQKMAEILENDAKEAAEWRRGTDGGR